MYRLDDFECIGEQYAIRKNFYVKIDEVLILMVLPHFRPPVIQKVEKSLRLFLAVW